MTTFFEGPKDCEVTQCSCSAMYPVLSAWDSRLGAALDRGLANGMNEGHKVCRRAKTLRAVRKPWLEIAEAEWAEKQAVRRVCDCSQQTSGCSL